MARLVRSHQSATCRVGPSQYRSSLSSAVSWTAPLPDRAGAKDRCRCPGRGDWGGLVWTRLVEIGRALGLLKPISARSVPSEMDRTRVQASTTPSANVPSTIAAPISTTKGQSQPATGSSTLSATAGSPTVDHGTDRATSSPTIQARGTQLYLNGLPYHFVGVNAYELPPSGAPTPGAVHNSVMLSSISCSLLSRQTHSFASGPFRRRWRPTWQPTSSIGVLSTGCLLRQPHTIRGSSPSLEDRGAAVTAATGRILPGIQVDFAMSTMILRRRMDGDLRRFPTGPISRTW